MFRKPWIKRMKNKDISQEAHTHRLCRQFSRVHLFQLLTLPAFNLCSTKRNQQQESWGYGVRRWEQGWGSPMPNFACQLVNKDVYETFTIVYETFTIVYKSFSFVPRPLPSCLSLAVCLTIQQVTRSWARAWERGYKTFTCIHQNI